MAKRRSLALVGIALSGLSLLAGARVEYDPRPEARAVHETGGHTASSRQTLNVPQHEIDSIKQQRERRHLQSLVALEGDQSCPCLTRYQLDPINLQNLSLETLTFLGDNRIDTDEYGYGCRRQNTNTSYCAPDACDGCDRTAICEAQWCWVDPSQCALSNRLSEFDRHVSYATCGEIDVYSTENRLQILQRRGQLRVGLNTNSGGWAGAYSSEKKHFQGPLDLWTGPAVDFVKRAAEYANVTLQVTEPPAALLNKSLEFFGPSPFDYCVYATALGYLDFCVAQFTLTNNRTSAAEWFVLGSEDLYLIAKVENKVYYKWDRALASVGIVFKPFTVGTWMFIVIFAIPVLGGLVVVHEYGKPGSSYPRNENVILTFKNGDAEVIEQRIPLWRHVIFAIYAGFLSILQMSYLPSLVSYGAMIHLLGASFFVLTIVATYTANLASILTQQLQVSTISSLDDAMSRGYRFCTTRQIYEITSPLYGIEDFAYVVDPMEEGGDGKPGFVCENCNVRSRVFDFLDPDKARTDPRYCHAAVAFVEDLQVQQNQGLHCNKTVVGDRINRAETGMPLFEGVSAELSSLFNIMMNANVYSKLLIEYEPVSQCTTPLLHTGETDNGSLTISELSGIWVVSFLFAIVGVLITWCQVIRYQVTGKKTRSLLRYDQAGTSVNRLERADESFLEKSSVHGRLPVVDSENEPNVSRESSESGVEAPSRWQKMLTLGASEEGLHRRSVAETIRE